jgi:uncharacterized protein YkwD
VVPQARNADKASAAFVNSPHHYANLVDPDFNSIGLGVVRRPDVRGGIEIKRPPMAWRLVA